MNSVRLRVALIAMVSSACLPIAVAWPRAEGKHRVTAGDAATLAQPLYMSLSPDGSELVYTVGEEKSELWLIDTRPGSHPGRLARGSIPKLSPDGRQLAFYSTQSGVLQLWIRDMVSGRSRQVTRLPKGIDPDPWSRFTGYYYDSL